MRKEELTEEEKKERADRCIKGWNKHHDDNIKFAENSKKAYFEEFYNKNGFYPDGSYKYNK